MKITIRQETPEDQAAIAEIIEAAFKDQEFSDHKEQFLVDRLRNSDTFVPELALVAEAKHEIIGHILLTKIRIQNGENSFDSLALAPVSVKPEFQGRGIGGQLIRESHNVARELGYRSVVLLGHPTYYPKFGYEPAANYGIELPFEVPAENCMVTALVENGLAGVSGKVAYPKPFFEA
jgi:predicted N-acetyltransferase YhbS